MDDTQASRLPHSTRITAAAAAALCEMSYSSPESVSPSEVARLVAQPAYGEKFLKIDDLLVWLINCQTRIVCVVRGTVFENKASALRNLDAELSQHWCGPGGIHSGYLVANSDMFPAIALTINKWQPENGHRKPVTYIGHSAGGALAAISASTGWFASTVRSLHNFRPDQLLTFGSPRVGDAEFASQFDVMAFAGVDCRRFTNCNDIIPRLPPASCGYQHGVPESYINRHGRIVENPWTIARVYDGLIQRAATPTWFDSIAGHSIANYRHKLEQAAL